MTSKEQQSEMPGDSSSSVSASVPFADNDNAGVFNSSTDDGHSSDGDHSSRPSEVSSAVAARRERATRRRQDRLAEKGSGHTTNTADDQQADCGDDDVNHVPDANECSLDRMPSVNRDQMHMVKNQIDEQFEQIRSTARTAATGASHQTDGSSSKSGMVSSPLGQAQSPGAYTTRGRGFGAPPRMAPAVQQGEEVAHEAGTRVQNIRDTPPTIDDSDRSKEKTRPSMPTLEAELVRSTRTFAPHFKATKSKTRLELTESSRDILNGVVDTAEVTPAIVAEATPAQDDQQRSTHLWLITIIVVIAITVGTIGVILSRRKEPETIERGTPGDDETIAKVPETICLEWNPGAGISKLCSVNETMTQGGGVANVVATSYLSGFPHADLAILNSGSLRSDIAAGNFTPGDVYDIFEFNNRLIEVSINGAGIISVLEEALDFIFADPENPMNGAYPYASALRYAVDMTADFGNRVSEVQVQGETTGSWDPIDNDSVYQVITNSYIAEGGDNYTSFLDYERMETGVEVHDNFVEFALGEGVLRNPDEYSTISYIPHESQEEQQAI